MDITTRRRTYAVLLALIAGIWGAHRFYLRQYVRGFLYMCYPIAVITGIAYSTGTLDILRDQVSIEGTTDIWYFLLPLLVIPLFDAWWLFRMSDDRFRERYSFQPLTPLSRMLSFLLPLAGIVFNLLMYTQLFSTVRPDTGGNPTVILTAAALAEAYHQESADWQGKVVRLTATLVEEEIELTEAGERHSWVVGPASMPILCRLHPDFSAEAARWRPGEQHTLQGWVETDLSNKIILEDCRPIP